jgi:hypothetical protein
MDDLQKSPKLFEKVKSYLDANVWDGEDRSGCKSDWAKFNPDELQELVEDLIEHLFDS